MRLAKYMLAGSAFFTLTGLIAFFVIAGNEVETTTRGAPTRLPQSTHHAGRVADDARAPGDEPTRSPQYPSTGVEMWDSRQLESAIEASGFERNRITRARPDAQIGRNDRSVTEPYPSTGVEMLDPVQASPRRFQDRNQPTAEEQTKAIAAVREYLKADLQHLQAEFKVTRMHNGSWWEAAYLVSVQWFEVDDDGRKGFLMGGGSAVLLSKDWKVVHVIGGA